MWLRAGDKRLEASFLGPAPDRADTLVFLHEGLGSAAQWRDFPARLAEALGMGALVYSRAGYGRSESITLPRPLSYMHDEGERVVGEVLDAACVERAWLVGHSDGASIALVHAGAAAARGRIRGLLLEAPHVFCEDVSLTAIERAKADFEHGPLRERLARWHDDVDAAFRGWNDAWLDPRFRAWTIAPSLSQIEAPVLSIQGEDDPYGTLAQLDAIEAAVPAACRVVLPKCGHAPHRERPEETLAAMIEFVSNHRG